MKNQICTLGLLAAALIIAPNAAFAGQSQNANQELNQSVIIHGSGNSGNVSGTQITNQNQRKSGYCSHRSGSQRQYSDQLLNQHVGISGHRNRVNVNGVQRTNQNQVNASRGC